MPGPTPFSLAAADVDSSLTARIAGGDHTAFEAMMRQHNGRLFRVARSIVRDDAEAEDALQEAYLDAYRHIQEFRGGSQLGTWLTRIVINRALMRLRQQKRDPVVVSMGIRRPSHGENAAPGELDLNLVADEKVELPTTATLRGELRRMLERRIDELPLPFRTVFVMREVEGMTVQETAESLDIPEPTVRTRLFRSRALLREALARDLDVATFDLFGFGGERCDRIVAAVLARLP
jgi:RNA polymerase sigma-70 factor, ECF subfamily